MRCTPEARAAALCDLDERNLRRRRTPAEDGRVNFCSNDYLGLARDPGVAAAMAEAAQRWLASCSLQDTSGSWRAALTVSGC